MTTHTSDLARPDDTMAAVTPIIESVMARRRIPGLSLAIADASGLRHAAGFGTADLASSTPATSETSYLWFSLTKIVTATAIVRLVDEGRLDLATPAAEFVADVRPDRDGRHATIGDLLSHTAGLGNPMPIRWVRPAAQQPIAPDEFVSRLLERHGRPRHRVGAEARYSNLGYLVLGEVVATVSGESFEEYVRQAVLEPAGMHHTGFAHHPDRSPATGHIRIPRVAVPALKAMLPSSLVGPRAGGSTPLRPFYVEGASYGGLVGDVTDAARLMTLHLADGTIDGRPVIEPDSARRMRTITALGPRFDLGQGWFRDRRHRDLAPPYVQHLGVGGGFYNVMRLYPTEGVGIVVMTNNTSSFPHHELLEAIRRAVT